MDATLSHAFAEEFDTLAAFEPRRAEAYAQQALAQTLRAGRNEHSVQELLKHPGIWRRSSAAPLVRALPTGLAQLDALLPGGGWPCGALTEILFEYDGV